MTKTEEFIAKANIVHNGHYSYENAIYVNANTKILITCPMHGDFNQRATNHLQGRGCRKCSKVESYTTDEFIAKANLIHNNKFTYDKFIYKNALTPAIITCKIHGDFKQAPGTHLYGVGCFECRVDTIRLTQNEFVLRSNKIHNNKYNYDKVKFINVDTRVIITCQTHGDFEQYPKNHMKSSGCPKCSVRGFDRSSSGSFYIQELSIKDNVIGYKFGIAKKCESRMKIQKSVSKCEHKLIVKLDGDGEYIFQMERFIVDKLKKYDTISKEIVPDGYTETILGKDGLSLITEAMEEFKCLKK